MFVQIVDDVRTYFAAQTIDARVDEGIEARTSQSNYGPGTANRVVFAPSEDPIPIVPVTHIGEDDDGHRQLLNPLFIFNVCFAGFDNTNPTRDLLHRRVCWSLWEAVTQAIQLAYNGAFEWTGARWSLEKKHIVHGAELVASLAINVPLFDVTYPIRRPHPKPGLPKPVDEEP